MKCFERKREQEQKDYERNLASATAQHVSVVKEKELHLSKTMSFHEEKTSEYETAATALNQQQEDLKKRFKKSNDDRDKLEMELMILKKKYKKDLNKLRQEKQELLAESS